MQERSSPPRVPRSAWLPALLCLAMPILAEDPPEDTRTGKAEEVPDTALVTLDAIDVTSSYSMLREEIPNQTLDREEIMALPHFGDDLYRAVMVLPATSGGDISGRFNVRGGLYEEVLVRLDGLELFEPFHLKDYQGVFSIFDPEVIGGVELYPGSYPAEYGDRMSGVLEMTTLSAPPRRQVLGISLTNAWVGSSGVFGGGRGHWLTSLRRGHLDLLLSGTDLSSDSDSDPSYSEYVDPEVGNLRNVDPKTAYWDVFGKLSYDLHAGSSLSFQVLAADDSLLYRNIEQQGLEVTEAHTGYGSAYVWLNHQARVGSRSVVQTVISAGRIDRDRDVTHDEPGEDFSLFDDRRLEVYGLRQDWSFQPGERQYLKWGLEARSYDAVYDYFNHVRVRYPIPDDRFQAKLNTTAFDEGFASESWTLYAADRLRLGARWTVEGGLRYDHQDWTGEGGQVSPRLNLVYNPGAAGVLRFGWGQFYQSQRPHELDVVYGQTEFLGAERAEHWTVGYELGFGEGYRLHADLYLRRVDDPLPRFEVLFDPWFPVPEVRSDRVRIDADEVVAQGFELYLKGREGRKVGWWLSYVYSSITDEVDGVEVQRSIDQPHALTASLHWRPGKRWNLSWVFTYHTGWPKTSIQASLLCAPCTPTEVRVVPHYEIGPFYAERHPAYHRLDMRASRSFRVGRGELSLFLDVQNLYNRENTRGLNIDDEVLIFRSDAPLGPRWDLEYPSETWLGIVPSIGLSWEF